MSARAVLLLVASAPLAASCLATGEADDDGEGAFSISVSAGDAAAVLDLVDYPGTTALFLDRDAGLDARAAAGIVAHRDGADGRPITSDDDAFETLAELDAVRYVGDAALGRLIAFARRSPAPASATVETVDFTGWQTEAVRYGVDHATFADLDAGLDARAARALVATAPHADLAAIAAAAYVGPAALSWLRDQAAAWWHAMHDGPAPCAIAVAARDDAAAQDLTRLLAHATTLDWPLAEVVALAAPTCLAWDDPAARAALAAALVQSRAIAWGYDPFEAPAVTTEWTPYGHLFLGAIEAEAGEIDQRVADGSWVPTGDDAALYERLPLLVNALTAGAHDDRADYVQLGLTLEAAECTQRAVVMMQLSTRRIWIAHSFPRC